jgi:mono/diheme cytochrome c family protein
MGASWGRWLLLALACAAWACDDTPAPARSAAPTHCCGVHSRFAAEPDPPATASVAKPRATHDVTQHDAGAPLDPAELMRMRGEYLVRHVAGCMECHTPRLASGAFDESKLLSGVENLADVEPDDAARGALHSRNLTPDKKTGLGDWTDKQIKRAFQQGIDDEGQVLHWMMPYWIFHNMNAADADAIVAFLRSIPKVVHDVPENQPNAIDTHDRSAAFVLDPALIPETTLDPAHADHASAERGRYLASSVAPCMLCHTPPLASDARVPTDTAKIFTGRRRFIPVKLGTPADENAPKIESWNLTPHENGIGAFSANDLANVLRKGVGRTGLPVCDPMPSYDGGSFRGMSAQDALDLGHYFTTIPPKDSGVVPVCCSACHGDDVDDAGRD